MIHDAFDTAADLTTATHAQRWAPGLGAVAQSEIFASSREGSGVGAALALALDAWRCRPREEGEEAEDRRAVVWVQTRAAVKAGGRPFRAGLPPEIRNRLIHVHIGVDAAMTGAICGLDLQVPSVDGLAILCVDHCTQPYARARTHSTHLHGSLSTADTAVA